MAAPIEASAISAGQTITALRWIRCTDKSYVGSVLKVIEVDLPFVVVEELASRHAYRTAEDERLSLDSREIEFGTISAGYIRSMTEKQKAVDATDQDDFDDLS